MAEVLTRAIYSLNMAHADSDIGRVSISVGVAMMTPAPGQPSLDLLRTADLALYEAKAGGRNRVVVKNAIDMDVAQSYAI